MNNYKDFKEIAQQYLIWFMTGLFLLTLLAQATTGGGKVLENRYGLDLCRRRSISCFGPVVYPPAFIKEGRASIWPCDIWLNSDPEHADIEWQESLCSARGHKQTLYTNSLHKLLYTNSSTQTRTLILLVFTYQQHHLKLCQVLSWWCQFFHPNQNTLQYPWNDK